MPSNPTAYKNNAGVVSRNLNASDTFPDAHFTGSLQHQNFLLPFKTEQLARPNQSSVGEELRPLAHQRLHA